MSRACWLLDAGRRYFRSTYFHRGQGARGPQAKTLEGAKREAIDAVFKKFEPAPQQFKADRARLVKKVVDKSVDLVATASDRLRWREVGEHGYACRSATRSWFCVQRVSAGGEARDHCPVLFVLHFVCGVIQVRHDGNGFGVRA